MSMNNKKLNARPKLKCGPSRTKQSFKDAVDVNKIVARFEKTGLVDHINKNQGSYADVSDMREYPEALRIIQKGKDLFSSLPASMREKFANNPANMIAFLDDPKNKKEAIKMGLLIIPKSPDAPHPAPAVPLTPSPSPQPAPTTPPAPAAPPTP